MKKRIVYTFQFVLILSLVLALPASASAPLPPQPPQPPQAVSGSHPSPQPVIDDLQAFKKSLSPSPSSGEIGINAVAMGASGTSFRYVRSFGETELPYQVDMTHLNRPSALLIHNNDLYVTEERGSRLLKFDLTNLTEPATAVWSLGHAGVPFANDDYLDTPTGIALDPSGNIWLAINSNVKEFDSAGNFIQTIPPSNPWEQGQDNMHFQGAHGLAFGPGGYLYVADRWNNRVQIYDISTTPPTYMATVGETGVVHVDSAGFDQPESIAFDSSNRMYVVDNINYRIQRCSSSGSWTDWSCETFFGDTRVPGDPTDLTRMFWSQSNTIINDILYLADTANNRVLSCDTSALTLPVTCSLFMNSTIDPIHGNLNGPTAFALDANAKAYIVDNENHRIQIFDTSPVLYADTIGVDYVPYLPGTRLNDPFGVAVAKDGSIYIGEDYGYRLLKLNASGVQQWTRGEAGVFGNDTSHFGSPWTGIHGNPAIDASGNVYVPDSDNARVKIYSAAGAYLGQLGDGTWGEGQYSFQFLQGVGINPSNGDIYVADRQNQRVQVYTSARIYKATIGLTGSAGDDNWRFNNPAGVAVDKNGNVFVADSDNDRVQKCHLADSSYICTTFAGVEGIVDSNFNHMHPVSVALDSAGKVYVADDWNNRVQVFNSSGAYLTTIGGNWGQRDGDFVSPNGVAVDGAGNVYITDSWNHRVQKYAPGVPNWKQVNLNGFGVMGNPMTGTLTTFGNALYAGTFSGQIWRSKDGINWVPLAANIDHCWGGLDTLYAFNNMLYAGLMNYNGCGASLLRSTDGINWEDVTPPFDRKSNYEIMELGSFNNALYFVTWTDATHGFELWRSPTGNPGTWTQIETNGFGDNNTFTALSLKVFAGNFYISTFSSTGTQVWRSASGDAGTWTQVNSNGFGDSGNRYSAMEILNNDLWLVTGHTFGSPAQIWHCHTCDNSDWVQIPNPFSDDTLSGMPGLKFANGKLYLFVRDGLMRVRIFESSNGSTWTESAPAGFGNINNLFTYYSNSITVFNNQLYAGIFNMTNGTQIWRASATVSATVKSVAAQDGWILESSRGSGVGGSMNSTATTLQLGDDAANRQYRVILSFNTSTIPAGAVINSVTLKIKQNGTPVGTNPFNIFGNLFTDVRKGVFGSSQNLELADFKAAATAAKVAAFGKVPSAGWYTATFSSAGKAAINKGGITQVRLYFNLPTNGNNKADFMKFLSGNNSLGQPYLTINYTLP